MSLEFLAWPKTPRLFRDMVITEKIDGTNAGIIIQRVGQHELGAYDHVLDVSDELDETAHFAVGAQSRKRLITPESDNHGFAAWVRDNAYNLYAVLGEGRHYGEWWGSGIQRGYGLQKGEKRFSLFNVKRYGPLLVNGAMYLGEVPALGLVPTLFEGPFETHAISTVLRLLVGAGSTAAPGFTKPEGIVVFHVAAGQVFKVTVEKDEAPKGVVKAESLTWTAE